MCHELCRGIVDVGAVDVDVDRENCHGSSRDGDGFLRKFHSANIELHVLLGCEMLKALVVVQENEGRTGIIPLSVGSIAPAQITVVTFLLFLVGTRENSFHRCEEVAEVLHECGLR